MNKHYRAAISGSGIRRELHKASFIRNGEFREPLKDEFYLSGALPEVYRAPNDLSTKYYICVTESP